MDDSEEEHITVSSVASSGKSEQIRDLSHRLLRESLTRQEIDEVYQKLQSEYDSLLAKHALAENTIDQLRIGARVNLFSDGPTPHQAQQLQVIEVRSNPQPVSLPSRERAVIRNPGLLSVPTCSEGNYIDKSSGGSPPNGTPINVLHRLKDLQNDIVAFQSAVADREVSYEQQKNLYSALKDRHNELKKELKKMKEGDEQSSGTNTAHRPLNHNFLDPTSLEGELYRLELRLTEVCDDIGDQLYANRENDNALEQALRDDFQRMRLSSMVSENARSRSLSGHHIPSNAKNEDELIPKFEKASRSNSDMTDAARNRTLSKDGEGSFSNYDKKGPLSPSNEDLAESGYYASESIIRESPNREVAANVPFRYLTRSRSPDEKASHSRPLRRHWSLSAYNSQSESIDEVTISDDETHFIDGRKSKQNAQPGAGRGANGQLNEDNSTGRSVKRTSMPSIKDGAHTTPVATSSPYEEKSIHEMVLTPQDKDSQIEPADDINTQRKRPKKATRASASDRSIVESRSDGRRSSVKSGSRLSKTRPKQYNYSSSEESYQRHRPERLNSSVYSEQDKVPSLVNLPKRNVFLSRHRPNTSESNRDSGFVGSEGTLKSQDLSNGVSYSPPKRIHKGSVAKPETAKEHLSPELTVDTAESLPIERHRRSSKRDSFVDNFSEGTRTSRAHSKDKNKAQHPEAFRTPSQVKQQSGKLRETGKRNCLDDVISLQTSPETQTDASFRRLPVTTERSPFSSSVRAVDMEDSPLRSAGQPQETDRRLRSTPSSLAKSPDPQRPAFRYEGDSQSRRSDSRKYRIRSSIGDNMQPDSHQSYDEESLLGRLVEPRSRRRERISPSVHDSSYGSRGGRTSHYADRLHNDLQLLRDQISQLNRKHFQEDGTRHPRNTRDHIMTPDIPRDQSYDDVKQKLSDLNDQLQKSLNQLRQRSLSQERDYKPNRDYQELKDKFDDLTRELERTQDYVFSPKQSYSRHQRPNTTFADLRETQPTFQRAPETQPTILTSPQTYITVCPVCSGVGYHKHGDYIFTGEPVHVIKGNIVHDSTPVNDHQVSPSIQPSLVQMPSSSAKIIASTPNRPMPNQHSVGISPVHSVPSTIHHIHTIHKSGKSKPSTSSNESQSDDEVERRRRLRRNRRNRSSSRQRERLANRHLDEYRDWRLNESLNEAAKAASNMQIASRRILDNLATDLIKSGYSEY